MTASLPPHKPVRIVIADDHPVFIEGFYNVMLRYADVQLIGHACNGIELVKLVKDKKPDMW